jgi:hypothetical protein
VLVGKLKRYFGFTSSTCCVTRPEKSEMLLQVLRERVNSLLVAPSSLHSAAAERSCCHAPSAHIKGYFKGAH